MLQSLLRNVRLFHGTYRPWQYDDKFLQVDYVQYYTVVRTHPRLEMVQDISDHRYTAVRWPH